MNGSQVKASAREIRRAFGADAVATFDAQTQAIERQDRAVAGLQHTTGAALLAFREAQQQVLAVQNTLLDDFLAFRSRSFRRRLHWLLFGV